jgi:hypothetical protein
VNQVDRVNGLNPLMCYLSNDDTDNDVIKYLIGAGTQLNQVSKQSKTVLMIYITGNNRKK